MTTCRVIASGGVRLGATYAFLSDGTRAIEAPAGSSPGYGERRLDDGQLTIEEAGIAYPTGIVRNDADHLALRGHNPAGTLDIELERVPDAALPPDALRCAAAIPPTASRGGSG